MLLPGCGSSGGGRNIPRATAQKLVDNIQAADNYSQQGRCGRAHTKVRDALFVQGQLPKSVSASVRQGIADGLSRLDSLISSECQPPQKTQTTPVQTQTTTTPSTTTPTTTTPSTTTPTTTTPTTTTPSTATPTTTTPTGTGTGTGTGTSTGNGGTPTGTGATGGTGQ